MRRAITAAVLVVSMLTLTSCGDGPSEPAVKPGAAKQIAVTFEGDSVTPNGQRFELGVGQPLTLKVTADKPGEIHVHSEPEQALKYDKGTSSVTVKPITKPGIVAVESHNLDKVILQLRVS